MTAAGRIRQLASGRSGYHCFGWKADVRARGIGRNLYLKEIY
jgi:hypothetical protein